MYQKTSGLAYKSILNSLGNKQYLVLKEISKRTQANLDIADSLHLPINSITPRTNELVEMGLVHEEYTDTHPKTGRKAIYWGLTTTGKKIFHTDIPWGQLAML